MCANTHLIQFLEFKHTDQSFCIHTAKEIAWSSLVKASQTNRKHCILVQLEFWLEKNTLNLLLILSISSKHYLILTLAGQEHTFSSNRPTGLIWSSSRDVRVFVCLMSLFMWYILRPILPPLPKVGCPKLLKIRNPWGKVLERSGLRIEHLLGCGLKSPHKKKFVFLLILPYKTWWKPRFPMD